MPGDVPVAKLPRRLTAASVRRRLPGARPALRPGTHAWERFFWLWDAYIAAVTVVTVVFIQLEGRGAHPWPPARHLAGVLVAGLLAWYVAYGRRHMRGLPPAWPHRLGYQAGVFALFSCAVLLNGATEIYILALVPQAFMIWPLLGAVVVLVLLYGTALTAALLRDQSLPGLAQMLPGIALGLGTMLLLSVVLSVYIGRIARQSYERAELIEQLAATRAEVARLSHEAGVAAERQRLAGDIHDTVAQGLSSVVMLVQAAEAELEHDRAAAAAHLALAVRTARENLVETRALVAALTPADLAGASLPDALGRLAARAGQPTTVGLDGTPRPLPIAMEVVLLRAAQESLTNVAKHAMAGQARVGIRYEADTVTLTVADDGCGFTRDTGGAGFGLAAMRHRVEQVGGTVTVDSTPGAGTTVRVRVPA